MARLPLHRYEIQVNLRVRTVIDAVDPDEAKLIAVQEIRDTGLEVVQANIQGQEVELGTDVGWTE